VTRGGSIEGSRSSVKSARNLLAFASLIFASGKE